MIQIAMFVYLRVVLLLIPIVAGFVQISGGTSISDHGQKYRLPTTFHKLKKHQKAGNGVALSK